MKRLILCSMSPTQRNASLGVHNLRFAAYLIAFGLILGACQHGGMPAATNVAGGASADGAAIPAQPARVSKDMYTIFYDQKAHLTGLMDEGNFADADRLLGEQADWFAANRDKALPALQRLADHFNGKKKPELEESTRQLESVTWPAARAQWPALRKTLSDAKARSAGYASETVLKDSAFALPEATRLAEALAAKEAPIRREAAERFAAFGHFGDGGFFDAYPVALVGDQFFRDNPALLDKALAKAKAAQIQKFADNYPLDAVGVDARRAIGEKLMAAYAAESGGKADLAAVLGAWKAAKVAGFEKLDLKGVKIAFVEVTSHTLLKHKQIEFSATVDVDLPVEATKADFDEALTNATAQAADYIIVFDVALAKASRRMTKSEAVRSRFVAGSEKEPNPEWDLLQMEIGSARDNLNQTRFQNTMNSYSYNSNPYASPAAGLFGAIGGLIAEGVAANEFEKRKMKMLSTPRYIEKPVYADYEYQKVATKGTKTMTVNYYVIDRRNKTYFKDTFDVVERRNFDVVYNVEDRDPDKDKHRGAGDTEATVDEWERAVSSIKLSQLVDHYLANRRAAKPLPGHEALRKEMLADKNVALGKFKEEKYDARPLNDPRFDHVVVVYAGGRRSLGTGFFIAPDIVLTNWHVVEGGQFVEMKMYDGMETFGKVIAMDVRLDLALVKVQARGKPVRFYTGTSLDLGLTVEAIGHPRSLEFSISRGVISAIRKHKNINVANKQMAKTGQVYGGGGGPEVLYIQTDTSINPGNSGGPLFLGDKVVGVNTWGQGGGGDTGLNFSVHYSEVQGFLNEYMPEHANWKKGN